MSHSPERFDFLDNNDPLTADQVEALHAARDYTTGELLYDKDPVWRRAVEEARLIVTEEQQARAVPAPAANADDLALLRQGYAERLPDGRLAVDAIPGRRAHIEKLMGEVFAGKRLATNADRTKITGTK